MFRSIPTSGLSRVHVKGLKIALWHVPLRELRIVVTNHTHTRVSYRDIISAEIARNDSSIGTRSVLCLRGEALFLGRSINTITTSIAITNKLEHSLAKWSGLEELTIGSKLMDSGTTLLALGAFLNNHLVYRTTTLDKIVRINQFDDILTWFHLDDTMRCSAGRSVDPDRVVVMEFSRSSFVSSTYLEVSSLHSERLTSESDTEIGSGPVERNAGALYSSTAYEGNTIVNCRDSLSRKAKRR